MQQKWDASASSWKGFMATARRALNGSDRFGNQIVHLIAADRLLDGQLQEIVDALCGAATAANLH